MILVVDQTAEDSSVTLGAADALSFKRMLESALKEENAAVFVKGRVDIDVMIPCARCLEEVRTPIRFDIDKKLTVREEGLVDEEMEEPDYLIGFELDVDKLVYAEILVNWPMRVLCKDDCKGICKVCGMNLNKGACSCQRTELDPRMAAIQDIFNRFKEV